jgi:hypothetical protein
MIANSGDYRPQASPPQRRVFGFGITQEPWFVTIFAPYCLRTNSGQRQCEHAALAPISVPQPAMPNYFAGANNS